MNYLEWLKNRHCENLFSAIRFFMGLVLLCLRGLRWLRKAAKIFALSVETGHFFDRSAVVVISRRFFYPGICSDFRLFLLNYVYHRG